MKEGWSRRIWTVEEGTDEGERGIMAPAAIPELEKVWAAALQKEGRVQDKPVLWALVANEICLVTE